MTMNNRRGFLKTLGVTAAGVASSSLALGQDQPRSRRSAARPARPSAEPKFKLGIASYTFREFSLDDTIKMTKRLGIEYIALKSFHMKLEASEEEIKAIAKKVRDAGLKLYGAGVIYMNSEAEVENAFKYSKAAGVETIIGVTKPNMLELLEEKVKEYDIKVAIHNHGPEDKTYPDPQTIYDNIKDLDPRIGICNDIGHTMRCGTDPSEPVMSFPERILDVHIKDVSAAEKSAHVTEVGRGVIDIPGLVRTLTRVGYEGILSFEYEKDGKDPLAGLAESVGYLRGVMAASARRMPMRRRIQRSEG